MEHTKNIASIGENIAVLYLKNKGYQIIARNKKISYWEIDIVAKKIDKIYLIEVKTVSQRSLIRAEDQFSKKKQKNIHKAFRAYCQFYCLNEENVNLELLAITLDYTNNIANIKHFLSIL